MSSNSTNSRNCGVSFEFLDEGSIFLSDKKLIQLVPLYSRSIASSCPEWLHPEAKFFFNIKFPFAEKHAMFFFEKIQGIQHLTTTNVRTRNFVREYFPETEDMGAADLRELLEIALFTESAIFEKCIYHVIWERTGRGEVEGVTKFLYSCTIPNAGLIPSTSKDGCDFKTNPEPSIN